jgi:hypothetical protein
MTLVPRVQSLLPPGWEWKKTATSICSSGSGNGPCAWVHYSWPSKFYQAARDGGPNSNHAGRYLHDLRSGCVRRVVGLAEIADGNSLLDVVDEISQPPRRHEVERERLLPISVIHLVGDRSRRTHVVDKDVDATTECRRSRDRDLGWAALGADYDRRPSTRARGKRLGQVFRATPESVSASATSLPLSPLAAVTRAILPVRLRSILCLPPLSGCCIEC